MTEFSIVAGMIVALIIGFLSYGKGYSDGLDKKDEDIEKMIVKALKSFIEDN